MTFRTFDYAAIEEEDITDGGDTGGGGTPGEQEE
jgi:hypothetical protein